MKTVVRRAHTLMLLRGQRLRVYDCCSMRGWPRYGTAKPTKRWFCVEPARKEDCGDAVCKHTRHVEVAYVGSHEGGVYSTILTITVSTRTFATRERQFTTNLPDCATPVLWVRKSVLYRTVHLPIICMGYLGKGPVLAFVFKK